MTLESFYSQVGLGLLRHPTIRVFGGRDLTPQFVDMLNECLGDGPVVVVADEAVAQQPPVKNLLSAIRGISLEIIVAGEPRIAKIEEYSSLVGNSSETFLGVGGGSAMDTAKYLARRARLDGKSPNLVVVPTLPGSGAEVSRNIVFFDEAGLKTAFREWHNAPNYAFIHSSFATTAPASALVMGAFDTFMHLVEPLTLLFERLDSFLPAIDGYLHILQRGLDLLDDSRDLGLQHLQMASTLGGDMISNFRSGLVHTLGETLSSYFPEVRHPCTLAVFAESVLGASPGYKSLVCSSRFANLELLDISYWRSLFAHYGTDFDVQHARERLRTLETVDFVNRAKRDTVILKEFDDPPLDELTLSHVVERAKEG